MAKRVCCRCAAEFDSKNHKSKTSRWWWRVEAYNDDDKQCVSEFCTTECLEAWAGGRVAKLPVGRVLCPGCGGEMRPLPEGAGLGRNSGVQVVRCADCGKHETGFSVKMVTFMVQVSTDSVIDELSNLGRVVFRSGLVDWVGLETEESNRAKIENTPGVLRVERERVATFC